MSNHNRGNSVNNHNNKNNAGVTRAEANLQRVAGADPKIEEKRPERIPVSGPRDVLTVISKEDGFVYRWVNSSIPGRVERFLAGYWDFVHHVTAVGAANVNSSETSDSTVALRSGSDTLYLMRIKKEYYEEDQEAKQRALNESEEAMFDEINNREGHYGSVTVTR